jgi:hypothetical protein
MVAKLCNFAAEFLEREWVFSMASRNEYILSRCKASNRCSINDEIIQLLDYRFSAVAERQGFMFRKHVTCAPILSLTRLIAAMLCLR